MELSELKEWLDELYDRYDSPDFIENDPIAIPHSFSKQEDIELSGFLSATIAWGNRKMIVRNAFRLMERMDRAPFDFNLQRFGAGAEPTVRLHPSHVQRG